MGTTVLSSTSSTMLLVDVCAVDRLGAVMITAPVGVIMLKFWWRSACVSVGCVPGGEIPGSSVPSSLVVPLRGFPACLDQLHFQVSRGCGTFSCLHKPLVLLSFSFFFNFYIIFKDYFPWTVISKYWLFSPCCTVHPWACLTSNTLQLPLRPHCPSHW